MLPETPHLATGQSGVIHRAPPAAPVAELRRAGRRFGAPTAPVAAVDGVSLALYPGEVLALLGPSGCGKSTTLRLLAGYERPDEGEVWIDGRLVATGPDAPRRVWEPPERRHLGMVFQDYALFPHLTVVENVAFGLRRLGRAERLARVTSLLETVGLTGLGDRYPHQLSGGQQQRVALARALAPRPRAVLLDEPFNTLDAGLREQVRRDLLAILRVERVAVVLVTHDQAEALTCADRVAVMRAGRLEQVDTPSALYNRPGTRFVASFVGEASYLPASVSRGRLYTPFGSLSVADPEVWLRTGPAELLVRPEDVAIEPDPQGNAVVALRRARGPDVDYDLVSRLGPDAADAAGSEQSSGGDAGAGYGQSRGQDARGQPAPSTLHAHAAAWLPPGSPVQVSLQPRHLVLFEGERAVLARCLIPNCNCPPPGAAPHEA